MVSQSGSPLAIAAGVAPALSDYQFSVSNLTGGADTAYLVNEWSGFGSTEVRVTDMERSLEDGDWLGNDTYASRTMALTLTIVGTSAADVHTKYDLLTRVWRTPKAAPVTELWWKFPGMAARRVIGRPRRIEANLSRVHVGIITAALEFYSPFSQVYGPTNTAIAGWAYGLVGGRTYAPEFTYPRWYGEDTRGKASIYNSTSQNYPLLYFRGPMESPLLYQSFPDRWIRFDDDLADGETLVVDMKLRTARMDGENWRTKLHTGSHWWALEVGENTLYTPRQTGRVDIKYANAWLG